MKKVVLAFGIPVLAVASLIGSGYATWYFNNTVNPANGTIAVEPTEKKVVGAKFQKIELAGATTKLVLDQTEKKDGMPNDRKGVHFEGGFWECLFADDGDDKTTDDTFVAGTSYKVTTTITIPAEVAEYVNFTYAFKDGETTTSTPDSFYIIKNITTKSVEESELPLFQFFEVSNGKTSQLKVSYKNEPTTSAEYETMKAAVSGKTIDIKFEAEIVK